MPSKYIKDDGRLMDLNEDAFNQDYLIDALDSTNPPPTTQILKKDHSAREIENMVYLGSLDEYFDSTEQIHLTSQDGSLVDPMDDDPTLDLFS